MSESRRSVSRGGHGCGCDELLEAYTRYARRVRGLTEGTLIGYRRCLSRFLQAAAGDRLSCSQWRPATVERFVVGYDRCRGPGARHVMHRALRSFLRFCRAYGHTSADLSGAVPALRHRYTDRLPKAMAAADMLALARSLDRRGRRGLRDAAIVCLLGTYGVRGVQVRRLRLDQIDWSADRIRFPAAKAGGEVEQVLTPEAGNRLLRYLREARPASRCAEVFVTAVAPYGCLTASSSLSGMVWRRLRQAHIRLPDGVSQGTHGFRHAFACRLVGHVPLRELADMLGHRCPSSTMLYAKVDFSALRQAALPWPGSRP